MLRMVAVGKTNSEIAYATCISAQTVKHHVASILRKLSAVDRTHAVVVALRDGLITMDELDEVERQAA
jgi:DNA-binding NarL/FixJ family response regulator